MDLAVVESHYARDPGLRFADTDGPWHRGWDAYRVWLSRVFSGATVRKQEFTPRDTWTALIGPETAVTTCIIDATIWSATASNPARLITRLSVVWRKDGSDWGIVHEHFSPYTGEFARSLGYDEIGARPR
jgi:ketosteroid isomerase-like protein